MVHSCFMDAKSHNPFCLLRLKREANKERKDGRAGAGTESFSLYKTVVLALRSWGMEGISVQPQAQFKARQTSGLLLCQALLMSCSLISIHWDKVNSGKYNSTSVLTCSLLPPSYDQRSKGHVFSASFFTPSNIGPWFFKLWHGTTLAVPRQRPFRSGGNKSQYGWNQRGQTGVEWLKMRAGLLDLPTTSSAQLTSMFPHFIPMTMINPNGHDQSQWHED